MINSGNKLVHGKKKKKKWEKEYPDITEKVKNNTFI